MYRKLDKPYSSCGHLKPTYGLGSEFISMLELLWEDLMRKFPELRPAFFRLDSLKKSKGYVETRFAGVEYENGMVCHDIKIRKDIIDLESWDMIQAIYHAAAHCLNYDRGIFDTINRAYHGESFKKTAEEIGLSTFWVDGFGYMTKLGGLRHNNALKIRNTRLKNIMPAKFVTPKGIAI